MPEIEHERAVTAGHLLHAAFQVPVWSTVLQLGPAHTSLSWRLPVGHHGLAVRRERSVLRACGGGQACVGGACVTTTSCNQNNCSGCCDGNTCRQPITWSNAQCGQGCPVAACIACSNGQTCSTSAGQCTNPPTDAGLPFDGGFPLTCTVDDDCGATACCGQAFGFGLCFEAFQLCLVGICDPFTRDCL